MEPVLDTAQIRGPRARSRERTREDIKRIALEQLDESGLSGVSVNAIAKRIGVTGPALYRYFASRDVLLAELAADARADLAEVMESALRRHRRKAPAARFRALAAEFRAWAHRRPSRYRLLPGSAGRSRSAETVLLLRPFLDVLSERARDEPGSRRTALDKELTAWWVEQGGGEVSPTVLRRGVLTWTRLHGVIGLELACSGAPVNRLFRAEVDNLLAEM